MQRPHWRVHWAVFADEAFEEGEAAFQESQRGVLLAKLELKQPQLVTTDDYVARRLGRLRIVPQKAFAKLKAALVVSQGLFRIALLAAAGQGRFRIRAAKNSRNFVAAFSPALARIAGTV